MAKVYLAGPISGLNYKGATDWRKYAAEGFDFYGIQALSPMRGKEYLSAFDSISGTGEEYAHISPMSTPRGVMTRDRNDATTCDVLLVNLLGAEKVSIGTVMEIAWADANRIPIVCVIEDKGNIHEHMMIQEAIGFRTANLDEAIRLAAAVIG